MILLEKAPELGGTAAKAAFWYWVPNNAAMRALGQADREEDFLRYVARVSRPAGYDPDSPTFGLTEWEHTEARESMSDGGRNSIRTMAAKAREDGVDIRVSHRVQRVVMDGGAVTGSRPPRPTGPPTASARARR